MRLLVFPLLLSTLVATAQAEPGPSRPALAFVNLPGWVEDDHGAALSAYRRTCMRGTRVCTAAKRALEKGGTAPRVFFETWFRPVEISPTGFLTGYFEPEVPGSTAPTAAHPTPLLARPRGLVMKPEAEPKGWPEGLVAARRTGAGYEALPDREGIETGALRQDARPLLYVDPVDAFMVQVQGSARIRLVDGHVLRVGYDGKNGHPYTAIGKVLAAQEGVPPAEMTADRLWAWLKSHPDKAPAVMRANRSFVFFKLAKTKENHGPVGGARVVLEAGRSLAVDHKLWRYGTPVWLEGDLPRPEGGTAPLRRLTIAQDTGTAIVGEARGDLFVGSGAQAGAEASLYRNRVRWVVLREKPRSKPGRRR